MSRYRQLSRKLQRILRTRRLPHWRALKRPRLRVVLAIFILAMVFVPPIVIETTCRQFEQAQTVENADQLTIDDSFYHRPETNTYLSFPEWVVIYTYGDLASMLHQSDEAVYSYAQAIGDYWGGFCRMNRLATADGGGTIDQKSTLYVSGIGFTADMAVRGLYENSIGRLTAWWRGPNRTREDFLARAVADSYGTFLRQHPWYDFPFFEAVETLWTKIPFDTTNIVRASERRVVLTIGWSIQAGMAWIAHLAASISPPETSVGAVVRGLQAADLGADSRIGLVRRMKPDLALIRVPDSSLTDIVGRLSLKNRQIVEIAGNQNILITAVTAPGILEVPPGTHIVFAQPIQSKPGLRRIGFNVRVPDLLSFINKLRSQAVILERVYDY